MGKIIYTDMVGDLLHYGHMNFLKQIYEKFIINTDNKLYIGVNGDEKTKSYKRLPVLTLKERCNMLEHCKYIDKIIPDAPLVITQQYIDSHKIKVLCVPNNRTNEEIKKWYTIPYNLDMIRKFPYTPEISTSQIIKRIKDRDDL